MELMQRIEQHFQESVSTQQATQLLLTPMIAEAAERIVQALISDGKLLVCGNGGSAACAQLLASEMVGRFEMERPGLAALALSTDSTTLTSIASDYDYDLVFSKQVYALGRAGDVLVVVSSSGNSPNVISAIHAAHDRQMSVIALTGRDGGQVTEVLGGEDILLCVPVERTCRVREAHLTIIHTLCDAVDFTLLGGE
jgi:D-sedoheptulose 7-phosphate isomerase